MSVERVYEPRAGETGRTHFTFPMHHIGQGMKLVSLNGHGPQGIWKSQT